MATTGPKGPRGEVAERILRAARIGFARDGFAGTSLQGIARAAGVDTKLVRYYYASKAALLATCIETPTALVQAIGAAGQAPIEVRGEAVVGAMLRSWADPDLALVLRTTLLIAAHEPVAMDRVRAIFVDGLIPALGMDPQDPETSTRGALISSQLLGLGFARFVYAIGPVADLSDAVVKRTIGATVQRYLTGELDDAE